MKLTFQIFQDDDDIRNGMIQLSFNDGVKTGCLYFTLPEWNDFKVAINKFRPKLNKEEFLEQTRRLIDKGENDQHLYIKNNPLTTLTKNGGMVDLDFGGALAVCLELPISVWYALKKGINSFTPESTFPNKESRGKE
jgi:hypothetical protein